MVHCIKAQSMENLEDKIDNILYIENSKIIDITFQVLTNNIDIYKKEIYAVIITEKIKNKKNEKQ